MGVWSFDRLKVCGRLRQWDPSQRDCCRRQPLVGRSGWVGKPRSRSRDAAFSRPSCNPLGTGESARSCAKGSSTISSRAVTVRFVCRRCGTDSGGSRGMWTRPTGYRLALERASTRVTLDSSRFVRVACCGWNDEMTSDGFRRRVRVSDGGDLF